MARNRKRYTAEFKAEALRLALRGDRSVAAISRELGVHAEVLRSWVRKHRDQDAAPEAAPESLETENRRLRRELARMTEERDILKKSDGVLRERVPVKCAFIQDHRDQWRVTTLCRVLEVSRARYYQWQRCPVSRSAAADGRLMPEIRATFVELHRRCGSPRVHRELRERGTRVGCKRVARLMREGGLRAKRPRSFRVTTQSGHAHPVAPNVLQRQFQVPQLNRVWGADITYLPTAEGWLYLAVVLDLCSRRVIGWAFSERLTQPLTLHALEMALAVRGPCPGVLHHSDRGRQYASAAYRQAVASAGMACSMSRSGDCWDNAMVESFFATLKIEIDLDRVWPTRAAARSEVVQFVEGWYNRRRRHSALDYLTPVEFEERQRQQAA